MRKFHLSSFLSESRAPLEALKTLHYVHPVTRMSIKVQHISGLHILQDDDLW